MVGVTATWLPVTKSDMDLSTEYKRLRSKKAVNEVLEYTFIFFGLIPYAFAVNQLLVPAEIVGGGLTGLAEILYFATNTAAPIWLTTLVANAFLLIVAMYLVGWRFCVRTVWGVLALSFWFRFIPIAKEPILHDTFMAVMIAGMLCGLGLSIVFLNNGSSGGTDIIAMIVNKYRRMSIGKVLFACDLVIISSAYFLPQNHRLEPILMGLCFTFMCTMTADSIMARARQSVQFFIFSKYKSAEIADAITQGIHRGVTEIDGIGWYSHKGVRMLFTVVRVHESNEVFRIIKSIDPNAFISQSVALGVFGKGFDSVLTNKKEQARAQELEALYEQEEASKTHHAEEFQD